MSQNQFVGVWRLVSAESKSSAGAVNYPLGRNLQGYLFYTPDGYMSVSIMQANRPSFATSDLQSGTPEEKLVAFSSYFSYCGRYEVTGGKIIHRVELSLFPNWTGGDQERFFEFIGDRLILSTAPVLLAGEEQTAQLIWQLAPEYQLP